MARKVYCENVLCKHHAGKDGCETTVKIGYGGKCLSFEKGFIYYFRMVWDALGSSNYIDAINLDDDLRIGIYYVMSVYHLGYSEMEWGLCRMILLKDGENGNALNYEEIVAREIDNEVFNKLYNEFKEGKLPKVQKVKCEKQSQPFGWLSPAGDFTEGDFAEHEEVASEIVREKRWTEEFQNWNNKNYGAKMMRDFLAEVKGYCLIHNPCGTGGYIVSNTKPLTKNQKDFLYGYFIDMGDRFKAEQYLEDGS